MGREAVMPYRYDFSGLNKSFVLCTQTDLLQPGRCQDRAPYPYLYPYLNRKIFQDCT